MDQVKSFIPPLAVSRILGVYNFEGGGYVALVGDGKPTTTAMLDMAQTLIDLKRKELAGIVQETDS